MSARLSAFKLDTQLQYQRCVAFIMVALFPGNLLIWHGLCAYIHIVYVRVYLSMRQQIICSQIEQAHTHNPINSSPFSLIESTNIIGFDFTIQSTLKLCMYVSL